MSAFCANGTSLSQPWVDRGFSHCFLATVGMASMFGILTLGGALQCFMYWKYARKIGAKHRSPSCLYLLQLITTVAMAIESVIKIILEAAFIGDKTVHGYQVMTVCISIPMWSFAFILLRLERRHLLRQLPSMGHGIVLVIFWAMAFVFENLAIASWASPHWWWGQKSPSERAQIGLWLTRYTCTAYLFLCGFHAPGLPDRKKKKQLLAPVEVIDDEDAKIDLKVVNGDAKEPSDDQTPVKTDRQSTWADLGYKAKFLFPFAWPKKDPILQVVVVICGGLLVAGRIVNLFIPIYNKKIVDSLTEGRISLAGTGGNNTASATGESGLPFRWDYILIYVFLRFLQGSGAGLTGLLNNLRNLLWINVQQYTVREVGVALVAHLHALSLRWHLSRKTGEVLRVMDRGTVSVNSLLSYFLFNILPTFVDICIAIVFFLTQFNIWFALIVFVTMTLYLAFTVMVTEWRAKFRRQMNTRDDSRNAQSVDAILNYETVKYYGAEEYEVNRYREHVLKFQRSEWIATAGLNMLNAIQNLIITLGFTAGSLLCAWFVSEGREGMTVGDYVLFCSYVLQLYTPLNQLGAFYRAIQQAFIDMENMFDLLQEDKEVEDALDATELKVTQGQLEFKDVSFYYYPSKQILKNISFTVLPGQTIALVGPSGSGKSTIIRLLFRFYDPQSGYIAFDGQDITKVTQKSLRQSIGVVPQDTCLFNDDIRFNVRYGRLDADDKEVEGAAIAADIHERILTFPEGYDTTVGERGLKLSGGEKQRVAIARTILKAPQFVLLDEATSALDTQTERNIQASLAKVCENKTTVIVAHRLSTIIHAHQILVLKEGEIVERGTHDDLLREGGIYAGMWQQQLTASEDTAPPQEGIRRRSEGGAGRGRGRGGGKGGGGKGGRDFDLDMD